MVINILVKDGVKPVESDRLEKALHLAERFGGGEGWMPQLVFLTIWPRRLLMPSIINEHYLSLIIYYLLLSLLLLSLLLLLPIPSISLDQLK